MKHKLKIQPNYFSNLIVGRKKAEIRYNDRDFQLGDTITFIHPVSGMADQGVGTQEFVITHIHSGLGLKEGFVCLSIEPKGGD